MKRLLFAVLSIAFCLNLAAQDQVFTYHTIQKGETLYHLTQVYQVTAEAICKLNPGLSATNFQAGKTIAIPVKDGKTEEKKYEEILVIDRPEGVTDKCRDMHKVKRKETIYGIAREYDITEEELRNANPEMLDPNYKLKKGTFICIPYKTKLVKKEIIPTDEELIEANRPQIQTPNEIRVGLILPFSSPTRGKNLSAKMYYKGFMLAADSLKKEGVNMDIIIGDSGKGEEKMDSILSSDLIKRCNVLFCPQAELTQSKLSAFAKQNQIRVVMTKGDFVENNPFLFITNPERGQYVQTTEHFMRKFKGANIIILAMNDNNSSTQRGGLTAAIKDACTANGIEYKILSVDASNEKMLAELSTKKENVIVPNSCDIKLLRKTLLPKLTKFLEKNTKYNITLFGHQEWLQVANDEKSAFYTLNTHMYTRYWFNPNNSDAKQLAYKYKYWFKEDLPTRMPSVPTIGFDTAYYILKGINQYGDAFEQNIQNVDFKPYQNFTDFKRVSNWGGFVNHKVGFVHFMTSKKVNVEF